MFYIFWAKRPKIVKNFRTLSRCKIFKVGTLFSILWPLILCKFYRGTLREPFLIVRLLNCFLPKNKLTLSQFIGIHDTICSSFHVKPSKKIKMNTLTVEKEQESLTESLTAKQN